RDRELGRHLCSRPGAGRSRRSSRQVPLSPDDREPEVNGKRDSELTECGVTGQGGSTPVLRHPFNWKRISMAAALAYRWDGARTRLFFWTQDGNYNEESLIEFIRDPRRHFRGERVILLWDRLPSHRSRMMIEFGRAAALAGRAASARLRARAEPGRGAVVEPEEPGARQPMRD